jgi:hypothetical protein
LSAIANIQFLQNLFLGPILFVESS